MPNLRSMHEGVVPPWLNYYLGREVMTRICWLGRPAIAYKLCFEVGGNSCQMVKYIKL